MDSSIYIGFDGGGSTSRFLVKRGDKDPEMHSFPLNLKYTDLGIEASAKGFVKCLGELLQEDISSLNAMCISLSGASNEAMNNQFADALRKELNLPMLRLHVESDSSFALLTAYPDDRSGMLLIAGTGSVAIAKKTNGEIVKVGGWGRILGDEGSGYWIGLQAVKHYCKALDGIDERDHLFAAVEEKLQNEGAVDLGILRTKLYGHEMKMQEYAPLVFDAHSEDPAAEDILFEAAIKLSLEIESLLKKVEGKCEPIIALYGGIACQPFIARSIESNCSSSGLRFEKLIEDNILQRALEISMSLVLSD